MKYRMKPVSATLRIYVALAIFQSYREFESGDTRYPSSEIKNDETRESKPGPLASQVKSLSTRLTPLQTKNFWIVRMKDYTPWKIDLLMLYEWNISRF